MSTSDLWRKERFFVRIGERLHGHDGEAIGKRVTPLTGIDDDQALELQIFQRDAHRRGEALAMIRRAENQRVKVFNNVCIGQF